jgi:hypothetical protein
MGTARCSTTLIKMRIRIENSQSSRLRTIELRWWEADCTAPPAEKKENFHARTT